MSLKMSKNCTEVVLSYARSLRNYGVYFTFENKCEPFSNAVLKWKMNIQGGIWFISTFTPIKIEEMEFT